MCARMSRSQLDVYAYFHVCVRGNNREVIFKHEQDYFRYLSVLQERLVSFKIKCFAFCLMTNHVHLLLRVPSLPMLSRAIHSAHTSYAIYFNIRNARSGHLFSDRFQSWVIRDQKHFLATKEYIEANPVEAGLVKEKKQYRWSSCNGDEPFVTQYPSMGY